MRRLSSRSPLEHTSAAAAAAAAAASATKRRALLILPAVIFTACVLLGSSRSRRSSQDWARSRRGIERASTSSFSFSDAASVDSSKTTASKAEKPSFCLRGPDLPWPGAHHLVDDAYGPETAPFASCAAIPGRGGRRGGGNGGSGGAASGGGSSTSSCREALQVPSVALLFLTRGPLPLEALWREWLLQAQGMLPLYCVAAAACANGGWDEVRSVRAACGGGGGGGQGGGGGGGFDHHRYDDNNNPDDPHLILGQRLFRVYTHAPPSFPGYPRESIFHGTLIGDKAVDDLGRPQHGGGDAQAAAGGPALKREQPEVYAPVRVLRADLPPGRGPPAVAPRAAVEGRRVRRRRLRRPSRRRGRGRRRRRRRKGARGEGTRSSAAAASKQAHEKPFLGALVVALRGSRRAPRGVAQVGAVVDGGR